MGNVAAELEILESPRYRAGTLGDLEITVYRDGTLNDPASAGTVTVADEDGNTLSSGAATVVGGSSGKLRYTPTAAAMSNVNRLTITWANVVLGTDPAITLTSYAEVVGDMLFTEAEARAYDGAAMANSSTYTDDDIRRAHDRIMDAFEDILGYPLGRRYFRETLDGTDEAELRLAHPYVRSIRQVQTRTAGTTTWTTWTQTQIDDIAFKRWGLLRRETLGDWPNGIQNVRVSYEAGKAIPPEIRRAGLIVLRNTLVASNIPDRALFETNSFGQFRLATANPERGWHFGLPEADAILNRQREMQVW